MKQINELSISDIERFPVWKFANLDDKYGEFSIYPVRTPVNNLKGCVVGTRIRLVTGLEIWSLIGNIDVSNPRLTHHFLSLSVISDGIWFTMARYHDFDSNKRGPIALANFLGLSVDDVFPITYDISQFCVGESTSLTGLIEKETREKLTRAELIALAVQ